MLYPEEIRISKTLKKIIKQDKFHLTIDTAFDQVINACAQIRIEKNEGTWIVQEMIDAYCRLHTAGFAHSVEAWYQGELAGGIYGVSLGKCFFGESMFSRISNASNITLVKLVEYLKTLSFDMLDCQIPTAHLIRLGAREIQRDVFLKQLKKSLEAPTRRGVWKFDRA